MDDVGYIESKRNTRLERRLQREVDTAGRGRQAAGPVEGEANGLQDLCRRVRAFQEELDAMGMGRPAAEEPAEGVALEAWPARPRFLKIVHGDESTIVNLDLVTLIEVGRGAKWVRIHVQGDEIVELNNRAQVERLLAMLQPEGV